jgi:hypothetical protein
MSGISERGINPESRSILHYHKTHNTTFIMQFPGNEDIWWEILQYHRISHSDETSEEAEHRSIQQRTLLSVAMTCSGLVDVALDELWRSMTTLEPAVRICDHDGSSRKSLEYNAKKAVWVSGS